MRVSPSRLLSYLHLIEGDVAKAVKVVVTEALSQELPVLPHLRTQTHTHCLSTFVERCFFFKYIFYLLFVVVIRFYRLIFILCELACLRCKQTHLKIPAKRKQNNNKTKTKKKKKGSEVRKSSEVKCSEVK